MPYQDIYLRLHKIENNVVFINDTGGKTTKQKHYKIQNRSLLLSSARLENFSIMVCTKLNYVLVSLALNYSKVSSSRLVYYPILELFVQRSQYIKFPLHKYLKILKCATNRNSLLLTTLWYLYKKKNAHCGPSLHTYLVYLLV